jgi:hypothetical protein
VHRAHVAGQPVTFGADVSQPPNAQFDCTTYPLGDGTNQRVIGVDDSSCTWATGQGDANNQSAGLITPAGTGTITTVRLHVGPTTGQMELVVLQLELNHATGILVCCSVVFVGQPFTPSAGGVTTIQTNIPVHTDGPGQQSSPPLQVGDMLGITVLEDGVPIPAIDERSSGLAQNQMPADDGWWPAYTQAHPTLASGTVGFQLDMNADWVPSGG